MPSKTSGRVIKPKKVLGSTPHQRNHRWESFTTRIAKLHSLDPLRKVRRHDLDAEDLSATTSYFRNGVEKWADLNISKPFTSFKREVLPLCETLPQILHFQDKIMELLTSYISLQDKEALEPLLDLLTAFAHDLGPRFEKHYEKSLELVISIAGKRQDVAVIEWTFAALAFLFKYLSRLLVPDLRPTYDMLAPLLGKTRHPQHIARFAAESMSFLIKKAAAPANREKALPAIVGHAKRDLMASVGSQQFELYQHGLMTMFAEAMQSSGTTLHSTAPDIFLSLLRAGTDEQAASEASEPWQDLCCGVLTAAIHHSDPDAFKPIADSIVSEITATIRDGNFPDAVWTLAFYIRLFGVMTGVRSGSRITDWPPLIRALSQSLESLAKQPAQVFDQQRSVVWESVMVNVTVTWGQAPMDSLIPFIGDLTRILAREPFMKFYIPFCAYFADLNQARFQALLQKHFQKFIVSHWSDGDNEELLCILLPKMARSGAFPPGGQKDSCPLPQSWQDQIVSKFERLEITPFPERGAYDKDPKTWRDKCLPKYSSLLDVLESTAVHPSTNARIAELLLKKLKLALRPSSSLATDETQFIVSQGLRAYLRMSKASGAVDPSLSPLLRAAAPRFCRIVGFLESFLEYESGIASQKGISSPPKNAGGSSPVEKDPLIESLTRNLATSSHALRIASLKLLDVLSTTPDQQSSLATMIQVEQTPLDHHNPRVIAVHLRKLAQSYQHLDDTTWLREAVPAFLFGMLTVRLSPVWDDAVEAMKVIAQAKSAEEAVSSLAFEWLDIPSRRWGSPQKQDDDRLRNVTTEFECREFQNLHKKSELIGDILSNPIDTLLQTFEKNRDSIAAHPDNARTKALKVLLAIPSLAEKRSRRLVPYIFSLGEGGGELSPEDDDDASPPQTGSWFFADRKTLLGIFAQFGNPKVLYQSEKVYEALLAFLANPDIEIQKLALKAILAWKQEGVRAYQEHLDYLLDEARFKNELTVLFQGEQKIQQEHRHELMPVLLRLLYGRATSRKGVASGRHGLHATRLAIIRNLTVEDLGGFLDICLGELRDIRVVDASGVRESNFEGEVMSARKQVGMLNMIESIIQELGSSVIAYAEPLVNAVLFCLITACRKQQDGAENDPDDEQSSDSALNKVARTTALKALCALFKNAQTFDWTPYRETIVSEVISPRIDKLPAETTEGVSATCRLLEVWSLLPRAALFFTVDERVIPKVIEFLHVEKSKDEVKIFALGVIKNLVKLAQAPAAESEYSELIKVDILEPNIDRALGGVNGLLGGARDASRNLLEACVDAVVDLAPLVEKSTNAQDLVHISTYLLKQPSGRVNPKVKGSLLLILERFITLQDLQVNLELKRNIYETLATLFSYFKDNQNRETLSRVFLVFAAQDSSLQEVADLCADLNSFVEGRLAEPDYDRRLRAYTAISSPRQIPFTVDQWLPLLYNMIFFLHEDEEFGILSSNSADGLCRFVDATLAVWEQSSEPFVEALSTIVLPAIYSGAREESETVRREVLRVFGHLVAALPQWPPVADLAVLVAQDEVESDKSFFYNILTPAVSKQVQALQLLIGANEQTEFGSKNVAHFFIPLLEHFIFGRVDGADDQGLGAQATSTIASLARSLEWPQYRALLRRYIGFLQSKPELQKQVIRLLDKSVETLISARLVDADLMDVEGVLQDQPKKRLSVTLPGQSKMGEEIVNGFLPPLLEHLHDKNEETVSARVPVGVIIVKLLKLVSKSLLDQKLPGVLADICQILRSKAWESREMARSTLAKISCILGPEAFGFVISELRGTLTKGYQLHVLSYTMHSLLLAVIPEFKQGELDYCVESIVAIIMDDIFGVTGQEKEAEEYTNKMKEIKSSKSQDSLELIAKNASTNHLVDLVKPLQALLMEKLDLRMVRKIDELLGRITAGLLQNSVVAENRDVLVFCFEVIQEVYNSEKPREEELIDPRIRRYLVQKGAKRSGERATTTKCTHKLVRFSIDIVRSVMRKYDSLRTAANISGFLPILGDAVIGDQDEVRIAAFKLLTVIAKVPFKTNDATNLFKVAAKEAIKSVSTAVSTTSDLSQTALKLVSVILRDRRDIQVKDAAVDVLLSRLKEDLTQPLYRNVTFNFLRSVLDRKIESATVYDTLDYVGTVMITNDDKGTRDLARGAFFQFLREYPQKKNRWQKQLSMILANLQYPREGGRLSVMEVIHLLLMKSADDFVQEVASSCFIPLVFVVANDDSETCRLAAGELVKEIFRKADRERLQKFLSLLRSWIEQDEKPAVTRLSLQAFGFYFEATEPSPKSKNDVDLVINKVTEILDESSDLDLICTSLVTIQVLLAKYASTILSSESQPLWDGISACLSRQSNEVRLNATKLLGSLLADFASNVKDGNKAQALTGSYGLELDQEQISKLVRRMLAVLTAPEVEESLAEEAVRILVFLGSFLDFHDETPSDAEDDEADEEGFFQKENERRVTVRYLFSRLARIIRRETRPKATLLVPKLAAMDALESFCKSVSRESLEPSLKTIIRPLRNLTDPSIPGPFSLDDLFKSRYEALKAKAQSIMDYLQRKLGVSDYSKQLLAVGEDVKDKRQQRSSKRKVEAITQPEKFGREKRKKFEKKKERRKARGQEHRSIRRGV